MAQDLTMEQPQPKIWGGGNQPLGAGYGKLMMWFFLLSDALTFSGFLTAYGIYRFKFQETWPVAEDVFTHFPYIQGDQPLLYVALMTFILILSSVTMVMAVHAGHHNNKKGVIIWLAATIVGGFFFLGSQAWEWSHFISGDKGAVQLENHTVMYVTDANGEQLSLAHLVHGDAAHGHGHHEAFTAEQVINAFKQNQSATLKEPGKAGVVMDRANALKEIEKIEVVQGANLVRNEYGNVLFADFFFFITGFHGFHVFSGVMINIIILINVIMGTYERRGHYDMIEKIGLYWHFVDLVWVFVFTFFYLV